MNKRLICIVLMVLLIVPWGENVLAQSDPLICDQFPAASTDVRTGYYMGEGMGYFEAGELAKALDSFSCVTDQINSSYIPGYMARAAVRVARRTYDEAITDYTAAIGLDAGYAAAYNNRAIAHAAEQNYDRAMGDLNQAIQIDGGYVLAYINRAVIYGVQDEFELAVADLEQAISLSGIDSVVADLTDPDRPADAVWPSYNRDHAQAYALLGIIHSAWALDNYNTYLMLTRSSGDARIQSAAGALESRFTFDLRLDDGTWLLLADFSPAGP
ncbi:MAG: hypothetical protein JXQ72_12145 [Anaerolineae bacterium]|nr:hypothetical protein [Anaerolineae bacterium]